MGGTLTRWEAALTESRIRGLLMGDLGRTQDPEMFRNCYKRKCCAVPNVYVSPKRMCGSLIASVMLFGRGLWEVIDQVMKVESS